MLAALLTVLVMTSMSAGNLRQLHVRCRRGERRCWSSQVVPTGFEAGSTGEKLGFSCLPAGRSMQKAPGLQQMNGYAASESEIAGIVCKRLGVFGEGRF